MKHIEMHCHSTLSYGRDTPDQVIDEAKRLALDFIVLTDHDIITPQEFQLSLTAADIQTCDAVEISARNYDLDKSLHLVSYAKIFHESLHEVLQSSRDAKMQMKWGQFDRMIYEFWFEGSREDFDAFMKQLWRKVETSNKYDISRYFFSLKANAQKMRDILWDLLDWDDVVARFYEECFKREGKLYETYGFEVPDYEPSVEQVVDEVVCSAGGIVSLAHPNVTFNENKWGIAEFERTIGNYVEKWVNGIEINTMASRDWVESIWEICKKYKLVLTFWSDCHMIWYDWQDKKHSSIGIMNPYIPEEELEVNFWKFQKRLWI